MKRSTYGYWQRDHNTSAAGKKFSVGLQVSFVYACEAQVGIIETMLENSAVVKILQSPSKSLIDFTTVINYKQLSLTKEG